MAHTILPHLTIVLLVLVTIVLVLLSYSIAEETGETDPLFLQLQHLRSKDTPPLQSHVKPLDSPDGHHNNHHRQHIGHHHPLGGRGGGAIPMHVHIPLQPSLFTYDLHDQPQTSSAASEFPSFSSASSILETIAGLKATEESDVSVKLIPASEGGHGEIIDIGVGMEPPSKLTHYTETESPLPPYGVINDHFEHKKAALTEVCGASAASALIEYAKYHARVLKGEEKPRFLVAVPVEAGLADRVSGVISLFWLAFFSRTAFQIGSFHSLPKFEAAYDYVFVNWTRQPLNDEEKYTAPAMYTYKDIRGYKGIRRYEDNIIDTSKFHLEFLINQDNRIHEIFQYTNLLQYPTTDRSYPHAQYIFASSNRGGIHYLFNNWYHKQHFLDELKLSSSNAFRCAYHFLFQNNEKVYEAIEEHVYKLEPASLYSIQQNRSKVIGQSELIHMVPRVSRHKGRRSRLSPTPQPTMAVIPPKIKIGIGIRVGDDAFDPDRDKEVKLDDFRYYLDCASSLEKGLTNELLNEVLKQVSNVDHHHVVWYVMSESLQLRQLIHDAYGDKVITNYNTTYFHGDCHSKTYGGCHQEKLDLAIIHAAAQLTLFALCDVHIVSESGFPRIAAEVAKDPHAMFMLSMYRNTYDFEKICQLGHPTPVELIQKTGCGIRKKV